MLSDQSLGQNLFNNSNVELNNLNISLHDQHISQRSQCDPQILQS